MRYAEKPEKYSFAQQLKLQQEVRKELGKDKTKLEASEFKHEFVLFLF